VAAPGSSTVITATAIAPAVKERPILFSGPMVRAILEGRKTQTRRVVQPQPKVVHALYDDASLETNCIFRNGDQRIHCPYGAPGDRLWVRETFGFEFTQRWKGEQGLSSPDRLTNMVYAASQKFPIMVNDDFRAEFSDMKWRPSIHMWRRVSRITLEITEVRVQRIQEINTTDAASEGALLDDSCDYKGAVGHSQLVGFQKLWDSINAKRGFGWDANPWVWAITFKRLA
jgi:hypothetical protein